MSVIPFTIDDIPPLDSTQMFITARSEYVRDFITPDIAHHILHILEEPEGYKQPGSFVTSLIETLCRADPGNTLRLSVAYPGYAWGVFTFKQLPEGLDWLKERARS